MILFGFIYLVIIYLVCILIMVNDYFLMLLCFDKLGIVYVVMGVFVGEKVNIIDL